VELYLVGDSGSPSVTSLFPRTPGTGKPRTLPLGICGAKIRPRKVNLLLEGVPSPSWLFKLVLVSRVVANLDWGRAGVQALSRWLPTAAARVRVRAAYGVCGG
jgi:hypothetical protein